MSFSCGPYLNNLDKNLDYYIFESCHQKGANKLIRKMGFLGNFKKTQKQKRNK